MNWPGVTAEWTPEGDFWPTPRPGGADDGPALRSVLVLKESGSVLGALRESDDRAVTSLCDARTPEELDEVERRARAAISLSIG
ncbi:hypothetical protein [Microtetraspora sp. NBRC 16547]|uniref:hypothetical protein n=1 Tax=Microtetraspora sp. NBRC 16547 TaxID=3030993 RepID=UPI0024A5D5D4|nr:hypothetical protein [Microtetraspora sp. NBRC 16547]GLW96864.1 hypothetical protein Misp02_09510 [Microtetraspora sp. NBRC 16547]